MAGGSLGALFGSEISRDFFKSSFNEYGLELFSLSSIFAIIFCDAIGDILYYLNQVYNSLEQGS